MKTPAQWRADVPVVGDLMDLKETFWLNPGLWPASEALAACPLTRADVEDAAARLERFAPLHQKGVPPDGGRRRDHRVPPGSHSPHAEGPGGTCRDSFCLKEDSHLPISGSIKARGGIYEVLHLAEDIAREGGDALPYRRLRCAGGAEVPGAVQPVRRGGGVPPGTWASPSAS